MLIVHHPEIEYLNDGNVKLKAAFEVNKVRREMWYSTTSEFGQYFSPDRGDAFILPLLFYAMKQNLSIKMEVPLSERLYYTITNYLIKAMAHVFQDWHEVSLESPISSELVQNVGGVGTGLSCGIDSFSTIIDHLSKRQPKGYRLTHCTFFNVGGHNPLSPSPDKIKKLFRDRAVRVRLCAEELGLPLVVVDSNMEEILGISFASTVTFRNVSAVLALQKLFKTYYCASGHSTYNFIFNQKDCSDYDIFSLPMVSTEALAFFSTGSLYSRVEKTSLVAMFPISYRHLNVCLFEDTNCSMCAKCLRTMLTLEVIGKLDLFRNVFNLDLYRENKAGFIGTVLLERKNNSHYQEIYDTMIKDGYNLLSKTSDYLSWYKYRLNNRIRHIIKNM